MLNFDLQLFTGTLKTDQLFAISGEEFHHCIRVTRHKLYDNILVTDFQGNIWKGPIIEIGTDFAMIDLKIVYRSESLEVPKIKIAISLLSQTDRFEWFVEKAVESGIHEIIPLICERSEKSKLRIERVQKIILTAGKQTLRPYLPVLHDSLTLKSLIDKIDAQQKFIAHCEAGEKLFLGSCCNPKQDILVLIGPPGDFSQTEINYCLTQGFMAVSLGEYRLRTETAGLTALQIVQTLKQLKST